jgi:hypothetical protein
MSCCLKTSCDLAQLRASVTVLETSEAAAAKAFDITNMQKVKAWVMGCPDPRQIANG